MKGRVRIDKCLVLEKQDLSLIGYYQFKELDMFAVKLSITKFLSVIWHQNKLTELSFSLELWSDLDQFV